jgi:hypothetical protein
MWYLESRMWYLESRMWYLGNRMWYLGNRMQYLEGSIYNWVYYYVILSPDGHWLPPVLKCCGMTSSPDWNGKPEVRWTLCGGRTWRVRRDWRGGGMLKVGSLLIRRETWDVRREIGDLGWGTCDLRWGYGVLKAWSYWRLINNLSFWRRTFLRLTR